jgi:dihydrolipoamide dehydrogenase
METRSVDVAVIGAGTAGLNARREVEKRGGTALLIESGPYGTMCARVGCMPSKLLIAAADAAHEVSSAGTFGIRVAPGAWQVDGAAVLQRVRQERDRFAGLTAEATGAISADLRLRGRARFLTPTILQVDDDTRVEARAVVIATGSTPWVPPPFDAIRDRIMVNDDIFELDDLPESLAVIGAGIIGLELGQAMARLGVRVSLFSRSGAMRPFTDPEVRRVAQETFAAELDLHLESQMQGATATADGIELRWRDRAGAEHSRRFARVLVAAGRRPDLADLNLSSSGLPVDARGHPVWNPRTTQCGDAPIFLAGDASRYLSLLHEASDEGRIAGANAMLYPNVTAHVRRTPLAIAFTDPQMALVGTRYSELSLEDVEIGQVSYDDQGRARVMGRNRGLLRLYARRECCSLIGAEMFGPRAEHMAHLLAWAVQQRLSVQQALQMPFYHPVLEEGVRTALRDLAARLKITGDCRAEDLAEAPGG